MALVRIALIVSMNAAMMISNLFVYVTQTLLDILSLELPSWNIGNYCKNIL